MRALLTALVILLFRLTVKAQDCVRANSDGGDGLPVFSDQGSNAPAISARSAQVIITSYQFHCCGRVGGWAAYLTTTLRMNAMKFQIWRPSGNNRYVKVGENSFPVINYVDFRRIEEEPSSSEQLDFQPGDVVGYYLENNRNAGNQLETGVQFDSNFNIEEVWYATGNSALQDECLLEVGSAGDLSMSTSLGPIISISLTTMVNDTCPSTFTSSIIFPTSTLLIFTPTPSIVHTTNSEFVTPTARVHSTKMLSSSVIPVSTSLPEESRAPLLTRLTMSASIGQQHSSTTLHHSYVSPTQSQEYTSTCTILGHPCSISHSSSNHANKAVTSSQMMSLISGISHSHTPLSTIGDDVDQHTGPKVDVGLHIGLTVAIAVLLLIVAVTVIIVCIVMKKRGKKPKGGITMISVHRRNIDTLPHRYSMEMMDLMIANKNIAYGRGLERNRDSEMYSYPINPFIVEDMYDTPTHGTPKSPSNSDHDYYVNEGLGGLKDFTMIKNEAYSTAAEVRSVESNAELKETEPNVVKERDCAITRCDPVIVEERDYASVCDPVIVEERDYDSIELTTDFHLFST